MASPRWFALPKVAESKRLCCLCLYRTGLGVKRICRHLSVSPKVALRWLREAGILEQQRRDLHEALKRSATDKCRVIAKAQTAARLQRQRAEYVASREAEQAERLVRRAARAAIPPVSVEAKRARAKAWRRANRASVAASNKAWRKANPERHKKILKRAHSQPIAKLTKNLRRRLRDFVKSAERKESTQQMVDCSWNELRQHIERQFKPGMSWANYGEWHIDHIVPCAYFDLTKAEERRRCFHFSNLRPLDGLVNCRRGHRVGHLTPGLGI